MSARDRICFIRTGSFSHINDSVLRILGRHFPDVDIDVLDTSTLPVARRYAEPLRALLALGHYGGKAVKSRSAIERFATRTPRYFDIARDSIRRQLRGRAYRFTFQTQSMIDGSLPGTPHFVHTDHTHLANLYYPGVSREDLYSDAWIERERSIYQSARVTFTMNEHVSRSLREHYRIAASQIECVRVGSNLAWPDAALLEERRYASKRILFVGVDWERKGGPQLLRAFAQVRARHPDATLTIVGTSPRITDPNVRVIGRIPLADVAAHFREAAIFCMPTRNEPVGIVFIEACGYRLPIVATTIGSLADLVQDGVSGYLVPPDDIDSLASRLLDLVADPEKCRRMGNAGFERAEKLYSWERTGQLVAARIHRELGLA